MTEFFNKSVAIVYMNDELLLSLYKNHSTDLLASKITVNKEFSLYIAIPIPIPKLE